jgi:N-acetyl-anhydromuramyl-L-alanine amidase AmpD
VIASNNQNSRVNYLVIHATSENFTESLRLLTTATNNPVSSHYLVPTENDTTYLGKDLKNFSLVPEERRAWHAGVSRWGWETGLNDRSIGIEIVNEFKCEDPQGDVNAAQLTDLECIFPPYSQQQIKLLTLLVKDILERHPQIEPINIVGHSDIALMRKSDPGPQFPWHDLYLQGIGAWPNDADVEEFLARSLRASPTISAVQRALLILGYAVEVTGTEDHSMAFALRALQLHFRPANYSGELDHQTVAILWALIKKYRPMEFQEWASELVFG